MLVRKVVVPAWILQIVLLPLKEEIRSSLPANPVKSPAMARERGIPSVPFTENKTGFSRVKAPWVLAGMYGSCGIRCRAGRLLTDKCCGIDRVGGSGRVTDSETSGRVRL